MGKSDTRGTHPHCDNNFWLRSSFLCRHSYKRYQRNARIRICNNRFIASKAVIIRGYQKSNLRLFWEMLFPCNRLQSSELWAVSFLQNIPFTSLRLRMPLSCAGPGIRGLGAHAVHIADDNSPMQHIQNCPLGFNGQTLDRFQRFFRICVLRFCYCHFVMLLSFVLPFPTTCGKI